MASCSVYFLTVWLLPRTFRLHILMLYPSDLYLFSVEVRLIVVCTNDSHNYKSGTALLESSWEYGAQFIMFVLFLIIHLKLPTQSSYHGLVELVREKGTRWINSTCAGVTFLVKNKSDCTDQFCKHDSSVLPDWIHTPLRLKVKLLQSQVFRLFTFWLEFLSRCVVMESPEVEKKSGSSAAVAPAPGFNSLHEWGRSHCLDSVGFWISEPDLTLSSWM